MALREQRTVNLEGYNEAANEGRLLLNNFVYEGMQRDGIENAPNFEELQGPMVLKGPSMESVREIGRALKSYGDDLMVEGDREVQALADRIPPEAEEQTILTVAGRIFDDGIFNWGRVAALFSFAYKVCVKAVGRIDIMKNVINTIVKYMKRHVVQWIIDNGGWEAILPFLKRQSTRKIAALVLGSLTVYAGVFLYQKYLS